MPNSSEMRRLSAKWTTGTGWPKRLEWIEIDGLRGWTGQQFVLRYPIMAVVGENGVGKSSVLQAAASIYKPPDRKGRFASDFFPDTAWEEIQNATIRYSVLEGTARTQSSLRKPGTRWRGNPERPERHVEYVDLSRIQPVAARVGYTRLVKSPHKEVSATAFDKARLNRYSQIMGRQYDLAKMALTDFDAKRPVPVLAQQAATYSGFHQGAGETTVAELLQADPPQYSIVLIDEIESSLHPRTQRRLIRDLAERCREREWQVVLTTHSSYVLSELPSEARAYILQLGSSRTIVYGVSPEFAMTQMDDVPQPECDIYVEDDRAQMLLTEVIVEHAQQLVHRYQIIPYGAASVGKSLGQMVEQRRFPRPSLVFLDGDQAAAPGCLRLPGDDAPERIVFEMLKARGWQGIDQRVGRPHAKVADACSRAMAISDHHDWVNDAATRLILGGDNLWQAMSAEWARNCLLKAEAEAVWRPIDDALIGVAAKPAPLARMTAPPPAFGEKPAKAEKPKATSAASPSAPKLPFEK